jgi:hypothetical protein
MDTQTKITKETLLADANELLADFDPDGRASAMRLFDKWLSRGDGVACYENEDMGSRDIGRRQFVSYGGAEAQIECGDGVPPQRMPDIGGNINWRYQLVVTWRLPKGGEDNG